MLNTQKALMLALLAVGATGCAKNANDDSGKSTAWDCHNVDVPNGGSTRECISTATSALIESRLGAITTANSEPPPPAEVYFCEPGSTAPECPPRVGGGRRFGSRHILVADAAALWLRLRLPEAVRT
jgi:hypothetical protein